MHSTNQYLILTAILQIALFQTNGTIILHPSKLFEQIKNKNNNNVLPSSSSSYAEEVDENDNEQLRQILNLMHTSIHSNNYEVWKNTNNIATTSNAEEDTSTSSSSTVGSTSIKVRKVKPSAFLDIQNVEEESRLLRRILLKEEQNTNHDKNSFPTFTLVEADEKPIPKQQEDASNRKEEDNSNENIDEDGDVELIQGARLLASSFKFLSSSAGFVAGTIRVLGETAGGVAGSSIRITGTAVKSVSVTLESASYVLEGKQAEGEDSHTIHGVNGGRSRGRGNVKDSDAPELVGKTRRVAGQTVRLVGSLFKGVGQSFLLVGSGTEQWTSSASKVAEDAVRVVEHVAGSFSDVFASMEHPTNQHRRHHAVPVEAGLHSSSGGGTRGNKEDTATRMSQKQSTSSSNENQIHPQHSTTTHTSSNDPQLNFFSRGFAADLYSWMIQLYHILITTTSASSTDLLMGDVGPTASMIRDILYSMTILIFVTTFFHHSYSVAKKGTNPTPTPTPTPTLSIQPKEGEDTSFIDISTMKCLELLHPIHPHPFVATSHTTNHNTIHPIETVIATPIPAKEDPPKPTSVWRRVGYITSLPFRLLLKLLQALFQVIRWTRSYIPPFRWIVLISVYITIPIYLCYISQVRFHAIQRNAEVYGFRNAILSFTTAHSKHGDTMNPTHFESVFWINTLLSQLWRVVDSSSKEGDGASSNREYGGIEPYLSKLIGMEIERVMDSYHPSSPDYVPIAYTSLQSITLGSTPPLIRGIQVSQTINQDPTNQTPSLHLRTDLDIHFIDSSIKLEVKLSPLEYATLLPSTVISISAIDVQIPLDISFTLQPDYPFVNTLNVTFQEKPTCKLRISPLSDNSGLRGVDLASLPVLDNWVQDVIEFGFRPYIYPSYMSINLTALFLSSSSTHMDKDHHNHSPNPYFQFAKNEPIQQASKIHNNDPDTVPDHTNTHTSTTKHTNMDFVQQHSNGDMTQPPIVPMNHQHHHRIMMRNIHELHNTPPFPNVPKTMLDHPFDTIKHHQYYHPLSTRNFDHTQKLKSVMNDISISSYDFKKERSATASAADSYSSSWNLDTIFTLSKNFLSFSADTTTPDLIDHYNTDDTTATTTTMEEDMIDGNKLHLIKNRHNAMGIEKDPQHFPTTVIKDKDSIGADKKTTTSPFQYLIPLSLALITAVVSSIDIFSNIPQKSSEKEEF